MAYAGLGGGAMVTCKLENTAATVRMTAKVH